MSRRAASISVAMSAIRKLTPWFIAIGMPNWTRSFAYSTACSYAACATPTAPIAVPGRVKSSVCIAILKPSPSSPSRFAAGHDDVLEARTAEVSVARWPILSRCFSIDDAGRVHRDDERRHAPVRPCAGRSSRRRPSRRRSPAFVMNVFEPLRTYSSPSRTAVVWMPATSEPAPGSVRPKQQRIGASSSGPSHCCFCSSVPAMRTGPAPRPFAPIDVPMPEQPQLSSSPTSMPSKHAELRGRRTPRAGAGSSGRPRAPSRSRRPDGSCCSSYSAACGRISFSANSRASSRSAFCSSVSANETPPATPVSTVAIGTLPGNRLTSQSISVAGASGAGQGAALRPAGRAGVALARGERDAQAAPRRDLVGGRVTASAGRCSGRTGPARPPSSPLVGAVDFPSEGSVEILGADDGPDRRAAAARVDRVRRPADAGRASPRC